MTNNQSRPSRLQCTAYLLTCGTKLMNMVNKLLWFSMLACWLDWAFSLKSTELPTRLQSSRWSAFLSCICSTWWWCIDEQATWSGEWKHDGVLKWFWGAVGWSLWKVCASELKWKDESMNVFCVSNMCVRLTLRRCQSGDRPYEAHKDSEHVLIAEVGNNQIAALWCADVITLWHAMGIILWHKVIICRDWNLPYSSQLKRVICSAHGTLWSYFVREMKKREREVLILSQDEWLSWLGAYALRRNWEGDWKIVEEDLG